MCIGLISSDLVYVVFFYPKKCFSNLKFTFDGSDSYSYLVACHAIFSLGLYKDGANIWNSENLNVISGIYGTSTGSR